MIMAAGDGVIVCLTSLFSHIIYIGRLPNDLQMLYFEETSGLLNCRNL